MNEESTPTKGHKNPFRAAGHLLGKVFGPVGRFARRHKRVTALIVILLIAGGGFLGWRTFAGRQAAPGGTAAFVRTTTLQKTSLENSISASGTVESNEVSTVTTSLKYTVKEVNVQVGDTVNEGDVICTLDTTDLDKQITKAKESLADNISKAQTSYDNAEASFEGIKVKYENAGIDYTNASNAYNTALSAFQAAQTTVAALQSTYDTAAANAQAAATNVATTYNNYTAVLAQNNNDTTVQAVIDAASAVNSACGAYNGTTFTAGGTVDNSSAAGGLAKTAADALAALNSGKSLCNYDALQSAATAAETARNTAYNAYTTLGTQYASTYQALTTASDTLDSSKTSDTLEDLQDQLEECTLKAQSAGTVTALNATVGSAVTDSTVATIQDVGALKISFTVEEYDIPNVSVGLPATITSDATGDTVINGKVSQVSKTASTSTASQGSSSSGGFACEVTVTDADTGLLIGMNAKVNIILSSEDDVFVVPIDAVGTDENGNSIVYVKTGGNGTNATFEAVQVTTGEENDYYIEISGDDLTEGMEVRSSADSEEATVNQSTDSANSESSGLGLLSGLTGGGGGGDMPSGGGNGGGPGGNGGGPMGG